MQVKVFSTPSCHWCIKVKQFLKEKNVIFTDYNVAEDEEARNQMIEKSGQMGVPVIEIDGNIIIGFDKEALQKMLGL